MEKKKDEEEEEDDTACIYCDKPWGVILWNGLYDDERVSIYLCDRCNRHLERPDTRELQALRIVSQRACTDLASGGQSFFDRMDLSALSMVLDEDNGKEVEKALEVVERQVVVATYYAHQVCSKFRKEETSTRHTVIGLNTTPFTSTGRKRTKKTIILKVLNLIGMRENIWIVSGHKKQKLNWQKTTPSNQATTTKNN